MIEEDIAINTLICEHIFGYSWVQHAPRQEVIPGYGSERYRFLAEPGWLGGIRRGDDPNWFVVPADMSRPISPQSEHLVYTKEISKAWRVLRVMSNFGDNLHKRSYRFHFYLSMDGKDITFMKSEGDAALHICESALRALDIDWIEWGKENETV